MQVIKRDGTLQPFDFKKIENAVNKAFNSKYKTNAPDEFIDYLRVICNSFTENKTVEEIQDLVENSLMEFKWFDVAKAYILYRENHNNVRNWVENKEKFINKYKNSFNTADSTVDDNSNVGGKNVGILNAEIHKPDNIQK